jgi:hypothetical protein
VDLTAPEAEQDDIDMSDDSRSFTSESSGSVHYSMELDDLTPMVEEKDMSFPLLVRRSSSVSLELNNPGPSGLRRDSPVPPNLLRWGFVNANGRGPVYGRVAPMKWGKEWMNGREKIGKLLKENWLWNQSAQPDQRSA